MLARLRVVFAVGVAMAVQQYLPSGAWGKTLLGAVMWMALHPAISGLPADPGRYWWALPVMIGICLLLAATESLIPAGLQLAIPVLVMGTGAVVMGWAPLSRWMAGRGDSRHS
jgi:hypothetical protein